MRLKAILFDKDGTLVDFAETWNRATGDVIRVLSDGDDGAAAQLAAIVHFDPASGMLLPTSPFVGGSIADLAPQWAGAIGVAADLDFIDRLVELFHEGSLRAVAPIGDPAALLSGLKGEGYRLGIITNDSEAGARAQSEKLGLTPWFDAIIGYDSGHGQKPEAGQILAFMARFGVAPSETALVGDTLHDLDAARAAGVVAIGVASGYLDADTLRPHADHVISNIMELPSLLDRMSEL